MASANKTEKPTPRRIEDARKKGQVAKSNDLNGAVVLATATVLMALVGPYTYETIAGMTRHMFSEMLLKAVTPEGFIILITSAVESIMLLIFPFFVGVAVMAVLANILQIKPMVSPQAIQPKLDKLNPVQGFKRIFSLRSVVEVIKAILKMTIVGACGTGVILVNQEHLMSLSHMLPVEAVGIVWGIIGNIAIYSVVIFLVLGMADYFYQKYEFEKQLRMTKQEVKDERKNLEGDPQIKRRIREIGIQMSRKRQLAAVRTADVIITNPTHISVAIKYDPDVGPAPIVVAKGQELFALKIREIAKEHNVPIVENKPVARALFAMVEVDHMIPPELFVSVAQVLAYIFSRQKGRRKRQPMKQTSRIDA